MPSLLHTRKVTDKTTNNRRIFAVIMLTLIAGIVVSFLAMLALSYKFGVRELGSGLGHPDNGGRLRRHLQPGESPAEPSQWVTIFTTGRCICDAGAGGLLPPVLLVADTPHRLFDGLQLRHENPVVQLFHRVAFQCTVHALWWGEVI